MTNVMLTSLQTHRSALAGTPMESCEEEMWKAVVERDTSQDGRFLFAVSSTGIYCRPSCPARRPCRQNVTFFYSAEEAERAGFRACLRCKPRAAENDPNLRLVKSVSRFIEQHLDETITLSRLAEEFSRSPFHLQRTFKAALGISPRAYAESCRVKLLRQNLQSGQTVTRAMYDAGYSSSSRLYEKAAAQLGMTPDKYRRGSIAEVVRYTCIDSPLGRMIIAATGKGICAIQFGDSDDELEQGLKREFPFAKWRRDDEGIREPANQLVLQMSGRAPDSALPLDIRATAFQRQVWSYLQSIPFGETRSYSQVARDIGQPTATRAVARACATNRIAIAIPCHRVVRETGELSGYRWGIERKRALLELEAESAAGASARSQE